MKATITITDTPNGDDPNEVSVGCAFDPPLIEEGPVSPAASLAIALLATIAEEKFGPVVTGEINADA